MALAGGFTAGGARAITADQVKVKVGLYSITYLGLWYRGRALTHAELIERARKFGYEGIEIDGKRPHGNPLDMPRKKCEEIRKRAEEAGVPIYAVAANNDLSSPIPEHRESQLVYLRELIRMAANLGVKVVRVFAAWRGVTVVPPPRGGGRYDIAIKVWNTAHEPFSPEQTWDWCRQGLIEAARWAGDHGITLALQNHVPVVNGYRDMLRMIREVDSPHLKACLDAPLLKNRDEASIREVARAVGSLQVLSHFGYEQRPDGTIVKPGTFYKPFVRAMAGIGYSGYIGYELCHPLPVIGGRTVGIDYVDKNARQAAEFMHGVIAEVKKEAAT